MKLTIINILPLIIFLFVGLESQAQIKQVVIGENAYYRTAPDNVVFLKRANQYYIYLECDGTKDTTQKFTEIKFVGSTFYDSSLIEIDREKYILTYSYSTVFKMNSQLINAFLNDELVWFRIGTGTKQLNTRKYKDSLIKLINK